MSSLNENDQQIENDRQIEQLKQIAIQTRRNAYAPYSHFMVGAAVITDDGTVFGGCNVENAAYGSTICAERVALTSAIANGIQAKQIKGLAVVGDTLDPITPCGACRQVIAELCSPTMMVWMGNLKGDWMVRSVRDLLPGAFTDQAFQREG